METARTFITQCSQLNESESYQLFFITEGKHTGRREHLLGEVIYAKGTFTNARGTSWDASEILAPVRRSWHGLSCIWSQFGISLIPEAQIIDLDDHRAQKAQTMAHDPLVGEGTL